MKYVIDGIRYHVDIRGEGFPLLLLHGFTGNHTTWSPFYEKWQESKSIAVDIIGHGESSSPEQVERYNMMSVVEDLNKLIGQMGLERVDLLGYSMGGRLALSFAVTYPQKVRKLILESSTPGIDDEDGREKRILQDLSLATYIEKNGMEPFVDYWENIPLFESQKRLSKSTQARIKDQRLKNSIIGLKNSLLGMGTGAQPSWWDQLEGFPIETLLLTGSLDEKFCGIAENMMKKLKNAKWEKINGCGHAIHVEEPEKFGTIVSRFLSNT
ncbi:2-succinyl-6-hydroxy-2,4-cyclohexadiene-1-carboxylate synthase [Cytobacillus sp. FJAT-54145]|uniref:Putative 2-succinyl-6-hydroxy-2,4-cyclohexadiene-1-carboxylate synthase n=1 Tax=Cytobacillus spartinae TaxID=3299023 RepID=A0ABW6KHS4_9BACI